MISKIILCGAWCVVLITYGMEDANKARLDLDRWSQDQKRIREEVKSELRFTKQLCGSYTTVLGLPMYELRQALHNLQYFD